MVGDWIRTNLGPKRIMTDLRDGLHAAIRVAEAAPDIALKTERLSRDITAMAEKGLRFDPRNCRGHRPGRSSPRPLGRVALWVIALTLIVIAWELL